MRKKLMEIIIAELGEFLLEKRKKEECWLNINLWIGRGREKLHNLYLKVIWSFKAKSPNFVLSSQQPSFFPFY